MSNENQEQNDIENVTDKQSAIDTSKRKFSKAGLAAPVIMTLASKPVFAVQGLSNMISGNQSTPDRGDCFSGGLTLAEWQSGNAANWGLTGFDPTTLTGTTAAVAFAPSTSGPAVAGVLIDLIQTDNEFTRVIQGLLNAKAFPGVYFMTETQFWGLYDGNISLPAGFATLGDLVSTYEGQAAPDCNI